MDKSEILKVVIQYLNEKGYTEVSTKLEQESKTTLESKHLSKLKSSINEGKYEEAIEIVLKHCNEREQIYLIPKIRVAEIFTSVMKNFDEDKSKNMVNQNETINLIRRICNSNNVYEKDSSIEKCSVLVFINKKAELLKKMKEISPTSFDKESLVEYIETTLSKSVSLLKSLHPKSLETMLDSVVSKQINCCLYHMNVNKDLDVEKNTNAKNNSNNSIFSYFEDHQCSKINIPYKCIYTIEKHDEEIVNLIPSHSGKYFAAVLKTNFIVIYALKKHIQNNLPSSESKTELKNESKNIPSIFISQISLIKAHDNQVTSLQWNLSESLILTASKDKTIKLFDVLSGECNLKIEDPAGNMISSAIFYNNEREILSSCLGQKLSLWNKEGILIDSIATVTVNEILFSKKLNLIILIAPTIKAVILFNYETKTEIEKLMINDTIVSTSISKKDNGEHLLINSSNATPVLSLWNISTRKIKRKFFGHRQERLTTKCGFGGENENFIISGSDNKEIYIWNRNSSIPISVIKAHGNCVNTVFWPCAGVLSNILVSGSDDHTIKIFANDQVDKVCLVDKENFENENGILQNGNKNNIEKKKNNTGENNQDLWYLDLEEESNSLDYEGEEDEENDSLFFLG